MIVSTANSYARAVLKDGPVGYWRLGEAIGTLAADSSGNAHDGTYVNSPTLGVAGALSNVTNTAITLASASSQHVTMGDVTAFEFAGAFTVEFWAKAANSVNAIAVSKALASTRGWGVTWSLGKIEFFALTSASATVFDITTTLAYGDGSYHHIVCTWDGTTTANKVQIYVDGVMVKQGTAGAGTPDANAARFSIGSLDLGGFFFNGSVDEVAVYAKELSATRVAAHYAARAKYEQVDPRLTDVLNTTGAKPAGRYLVTVDLTASDLDDSKALLEVQHRDSDNNSIPLESIIVAVPQDNCRQFDFGFVLEANERISVVPYTDIIGVVTVAFDIRSISGGVM